MNVKNRLRNNLVRKIQQLSTAKLTEITKLLSTLEHQLNAKEKQSSAVLTENIYIATCIKIILQ